MEIVVVGLDCKRAPVEVRERLSFTPDRLTEAYDRLIALPPLDEGAILSTCNRVEIYALSEHANQAETFGELRRFLSEFHNVAEDEFKPHLFYKAGRAAVEHLFEVSCGIKSMVLGEPQIQGQVRDTIENARRIGGAGRVLDALFRSAISTGKRARTETAISENGVSVSFTAIEMLDEAAGGLEGKRALVIGTGKTGRLSAQILLDRDVSDLVLVNRNLEHARATAHDLTSEIVRVQPFEKLVHVLSEVDVVVSCTSAPTAVVTVAQFEQVLSLREPNRPIYMVDIAVPRDIEAEVGELPGVSVWDIDDIKNVAEANMAKRTNEVGRVRAIIQEELNDFMAWFGALAVVPTITTLRQHADAIRRSELNRTVQALGQISEREARLLDDLTNRIVNKLLHEPTLRLKEAASSSDAGRYAEVVRHLFSLQGANNGHN
jgi:glutamyl-tRNA reductase